LGTTRNTFLEKYIFGQKTTRCVVF
jgi:hypothetical protein